VEDNVSAPSSFIANAHNDPLHGSAPFTQFLPEAETAARFVREKATSEKI